MTTVEDEMDIARKVEASITGTWNLLLIEGCKKLIEDIYTEPQNEEILECYLNQQEGEEHPQPRQRTKKKVLIKKEVPASRKWKEVAVSNVSSSKRNNTNKAIIKID